MAESSSVCFAVSATTQPLRISTMPRHHLLSVQGVKPCRVLRVGRDTEGTFIQLREPFEGRCPECNWRSRRRKTSGFHPVQGLGDKGLPVRVLVPWVEFHCGRGSCARRTFRWMPDTELLGIGRLLPAVHTKVRDLVFEHGLNHVEVVRILASLFAVNTSEPTVRRVLDAQRIVTPRKHAPKHLGIDERHPKGLRRKGRRQRKVRRFDLVLFDLELGCIIASVRGKDQRAARRLFEKAGRRVDLSQVETITRDLCSAWDAEIHRALDRDGRAVVVRVDDFHLVRHVLNEVYAKGFVGERQKLRKAGRTAEAREVFLLRFAFRARRRKLKARDRKYGTARDTRLRRLLDRNPRLRKLYQLKEAFLQLLERDATDPEFDQRYMRLVDRARAMRLNKLADSLIRHSEFVLNAKLFDGGRHLPEPCLSRYRHAERRRRSFRTEKSRDRWERAQLKSMILQRRRVA